MDSTERIYKPIGSPIISVTVKAWSCPYDDFFSGKKDSDIREFEALLERGQRVENDDECYVQSLCVRYISGIIDRASDKDADAVISKMLAVRRIYGEAFPLLSRQISEWICDFCLIGNYTGNLAEFYTEQLPGASFCSDFLIYSFISAFFSESGEGIGAKQALIPALSAMCAYDFPASECYAENTELYRRVFYCAMPVFFGALMNDYGRELFYPSPERCVRSAYAGLACTRTASRILEIEYLPFSACGELCELVTSFVKYCDNLVRQGLSVKSKLTGVGLMPEYRRLISEAVRVGVPGLLAPAMRVGRKPKSKKPDKAEPLKDANKGDEIPVIDLNIDFKRAKQLEAESWAIAELLAGDGDGDEVRIDFSPDKEAAVKASAAGLEAQSGDLLCENGEWGEFLLSLSEGERKILVCVLCGGDAAALSRSLGGMPLGFMDSINEKALDFCGDIVMECLIDGTLSIFEDYMDILSEIIDNTRGGFTSGRE